MRDYHVTRVRFRMEEEGRGCGCGEDREEDGGGVEKMQIVWASPLRRVPD
jgi:hypothetical protein